MSADYKSKLYWFCMQSENECIIPYICSCLVCVLTTKLLGAGYRGKGCFVTISVLLTLMRTKNKELSETSTYVVPMIKNVKHLVQNTINWFKA